MKQAMKALGLGLFYLSINFFAISAVAEALSDTLVPRGSDVSPTQSGLQSGRFEDRSGAPPVQDSDPDRSIQTNTKTKKPMNKEMQPVKEKPTPTGLPKAIKKKPASTDEPVQVIPLETKTEEAAPPFHEPSMVDQMKGIFTGKEIEAIDEYREQIHADDIRQNRIEVQLLPGLHYNSSQSNLSTRSYSSFFQGIELEARLWTTPFLGISGVYWSSLGADLPANGIRNSKVTAKYELAEVHFDFRKFFGMSRRSPSLTYGFYYSENKLVVPGDNTTRLGLKSNGVGLQVSGRFPVAPNYAWVVGGRFEPRASHSESPTGTTMSSGSSPEAIRFGIDVGGEIKFSRQNQLVWKIGYLVEKDQFSGTSSLPDPETGVVNENVGVSNSWTFFQFGYRWGQ